MYKPCDTDFQIERYIIPYLQDVPFFAEISRHIKKIATTDMPTLAVSYNAETDDVTMYYNPEFLKPMSTWEIRGCLNHEFYHLIFGHLNARRKNPPKMWNIATDLAINSIIVKNSARPRDSVEGDGSRPLPTCALIPGEWPVFPDGRKPTATEKEAMPLAKWIAEQKTDQASEYYFNALQQFVKEQQQKGQKQKGKGGKGQSDPNGEGGEGEPGEPGEGDEYDVLGGLDSMDDHSLWDDVPEGREEYVENRIKGIIEKAVRYADSSPNGWGNIPSELREDIRKSVSHIINWRNVLHQFIGQLCRGERTTSIKRINRRYAYIHPGTKRSYLPKLLVAFDDSGSVPMWMTEMFFAELGNLTKKTAISVVHFDTECGTPYEWARNQTIACARQRCGGTDFNAVSRLINDPRNRGRWDGVLILTDGEAPKPNPTLVRRGWVLGKGQKLYFDSNELQIFLDESRPMAGAWR